MISSQYGWTWDQIKQMTLKEVHIALIKINKRTTEEWSLRAQIAGVKVIPGVNNSVGQGSKFDKGEDQELMQAMQNAIQRRGLKRRG